MVTAARLRCKEIAGGDAAHATAAFAGELHETRGSTGILMERRPIRSDPQVLRFVTDQRPTYAGIDPYIFYIDCNSADNVMPAK